MSIRNNVSLIGNLGAQPNVTTTPNGTNITDFSLATNEYFRDRDGERQTRTMWHRVKAFGKTAEILGKYLTSGSQVAIEGRISYNKWIDKHDQVRISTEIIVEDFTFLSATASSRASEEPQVTVVAEPTAQTAPASRNGKSASKSKVTAKAKTSRAKAKAPVAALVDDDDLPF